MNPIWFFRYPKVNMNVTWTRHEGDVKNHRWFRYCELHRSFMHRARHSTSAVHTQLTWLGYECAQLRNYCDKQNDTPDFMIWKFEELKHRHETPVDAHMRTLQRLVRRLLDFRLNVGSVGSFVFFCIIWFQGINFCPKTRTRSSLLSGSFFLQQIYFDIIYRCSTSKISAWNEGNFVKVTDHW